MGKLKWINKNRKEAVNEFLQKNDLLTIIRGHEAQIDGYKMHRWNGSNEFPLVITLFSAANYCDAYKNKGAVIKFSVLYICFNYKGQYIECSAVFNLFSSLFTTKLYEFILMVYSFFMWESDWDVWLHRKEEKITIAVR